MKVLSLFFAVVALASTGHAQALSTNRAWRYTLIEGSTITEDCLICGRPTISYPLRGTFDLFLDHYDPQFAHYRITNINFSTPSNNSLTYTVVGAGTYRVGGAVAVLQSMSLTTTVCNVGAACREVAFTNTDNVRLPFPLIEISVTQTQQNLVSVYTTHLVAAPLRELWFVVTNRFVPTNGAPAIAAGDVLARTGRTVRSRTSLLASNGVATPPPDLRIDALDAAPGEGLVFSTGFPNTTPLRDGDLLSERGYVVRTNQALTAAFNIQPPVPDVGLDAVHVRSSGEILFSVRTNIFSQTKGLLQHGDVLSSTGSIVLRNQDLLARFHPPSTAVDYGLDALYVWPNGEIWFSTTTGFADQQLGAISDGDLLSTEGIIVFKNSDLVAEFAAPATPGGFGLGDIFVVTEASTLMSAPKLLPPIRSGNDMWLQWMGSNHVYRAERAEAVTGPWQALGEIDSATSVQDTNAGLLPQMFYRLQAW